MRSSALLAALALAVAAYYGRELWVELGHRERVDASLARAAAALRVPDDPEPDSGTMVIVEPRAHPMLEYVIRAFDAVVPPHWDLVVFHGTENAREAASAARGLRRATTLVDLGVPSLSFRVYNYTLLRQNFWRCVRGDHVLVFQTDSVPCRAALDVARFGAFGYVGCTLGPRVGRGQWGMLAPRSTSQYGIGGLSLRRRAFCLRACRAFEGADLPEDVAFSTFLDAPGHGFARPTARDLEEFCAQHTYGDAPRSFGAHKVASSGMRDKASFYAYCPSAKLT